MCMHFYLSAALELIIIPEEEAEWVFRLQTSVVIGIIHWCCGGRVSALYCLNVGARGWLF